MAKNYKDWKGVKSLPEGGQGWVHVVEKDGDKAVIKILKNLKRRDRFETELKSLQDLEGNFVPTIYDYDLDDARPYIVMEYFEKGCLSKKIIQGWTLKEKVEFYQALLNAMTPCITKASFTVI